MFSYLRVKGFLTEIDVCISTRGAIDSFIPPVQPVPREDHAGNTHDNQISISAGGRPIFNL